MSELVLSYLDVTKLALASFLARYREPTLGSYQVDLRCYLRWCAEVDVEPLRVTRGQLELYLRRLESAQYAPATIARRFTTVAVFLKYAVIDGHIPSNPADAVSRPKVDWQGQKRTVLHPLEFAALLATPTSTTSATSPATRSCTSSARAPSLPTSRCPSRCCAPSGRPPTAAGMDRSCSTILAAAWTPAPSPAACIGCARGPGSPTRSARTACAVPSAPPGSLPASRSATCKSPCATPTPERQCGTTWPRPTLIGTPPTPSPPTSLA
jgi:hypothetical protein